VAVIALFTVVGFLPQPSADGDPSKAGKSRIKEGAYYEFRGHIYDRSTIERNFTLYWGEGNQVIAVSRDTKIFRRGRPAQLNDVKSGDAVRGIGQVKNGKLIAYAVAFGDEGVELPASVKVPDSITLPPSIGSE
jgi:hypothetical protein